MLQYLQSESLQSQSPRDNQNLLPLRRRKSLRHPISRKLHHRITIEKYSFWKPFILSLINLCKNGIQDFRFATKKVKTRYRCLREKEVLWVTCARWLDAKIHPIFLVVTNGRNIARSTAKFSHRREKSFLRFRRWSRGWSSDSSVSIVRLISCSDPCAFATPRASQRCSCGSVKLWSSRCAEGLLRRSNRFANTREHL